MPSYRKMTPDTSDTLINGHTEKMGEKLLAQVDAAEAKKLYRYCLVSKNFCYYIRNAQISGSMSQGVDDREIKGFIAGIEAAEGPVEQFPVK